MKSRIDKIKLTIMGGVRRQVVILAKRLQLSITNSANIVSNVDKKNQQSKLKVQSSLKSRLYFLSRKQTWAQDNMVKKRSVFMRGMWIFFFAEER